MKKCKFCNKNLENNYFENNYFENKIGVFCSEDHFDKYLENLSDKEYIELQNNFCICSDE